MGNSKDNSESEIADQIAGKAAFDSVAITLLSDSVNRAKAILRPITMDHPLNGKFINPLEAVKIAMISYPIRISDGNGKFYPPDKTDEFPVTLKTCAFDHFDICIPTELSTESIQSWSDKIASDCLNAAFLGANFIVLHELAYPNYWPGRPVSIGSFEKTRKLNEIRVNLENQLQSISTENNVVIIGGSYHDWETFENISPIYFPVSRFSCHHKKITSARAVDEHIKVARGITYPVYNIGAQFSFCVLICSDAFDLNMLFRQILVRGTNDLSITPQIFFVPSFYIPKPERNSLLHACEQLSLATGSIVAFVNQRSDESGQAVFVAGRRLETDRHGAIALAHIDAVARAEAITETQAVRASLQLLFGETRKGF